MKIGLGFRIQGQWLWPFGWNGSTETWTRVYTTRYESTFSIAIALHAGMNILMKQTFR